MNAHCGDAYDLEMLTCEGQYVCRPWRSPGDAHLATLVRTIARYDRAMSKSPGDTVSYHLVVQKTAIATIVNNVYQLLVW